MPQVPPDDGEPIPWDEPEDDPPPPEAGDEDGDCIVASDSNGWPVWVGYASKAAWRLRLPGAEYADITTRDAVWAACDGDGLVEWPSDIIGVGGAVHYTTGARAAKKIADLRDTADV